MDGTFFSWEELRERADSLVNLENIVNLARDIEELIQIDEDDLNESRDKLLKAKTNLDILIRVLLTLLRRKFVVDKKIDTIVFHAFQENYGRIVMWLDKDVDFWEDHSYETINILRLKIMANKISEILYGDIYFPLDSAIEWEIENSRQKNEKVKRRWFLYALFWAVTNNVRVFGSEARFGKGKSAYSKLGSFSSMPLLPYEYLLSKKGQEGIEKGIDEGTKKLVDEMKGWDFGDETGSEMVEKSIS